MCYRNGAVTAASRASSSGFTTSPSIPRAISTPLKSGGDAAQKFIFVVDGADGQMITLNRDTGEVLSQWGRHGRQPGQFKWVHNVAIDSKGNLYTSEVGWGRRAQKFRRMQ